jgi:hypothetical protein
VNANVRKLHYEFPANGASLSGFTLLNGSVTVLGPPGGTGGGRFCESTSTVVSNCILTDMKTRIQKLLVGAALVGAATLVQAQFTYTNNGNGTCAITGYTGPGGPVTIPNSYHGLIVVGIGADAFYNNSSLTSVTVPDTVTNIGNYAFNYCTSLNGATLGNGVTGIGYYAFSYCFSLTNVTIPDSITSIGDWAFSHSGLTSVTIPANVTHLGVAPFAACSRMTAFTVDASNAYYSSLDGVLLNKSQTSVIEYPGGKIGSCAIPNSVTSIGDGAFLSCTSLTSVTIPASVTSIPGSPVSGAGAFFDCYNLQSVFFKGNAPATSPSPFFGDDYATVYYLPGSTGWGATFAGRPTALWALPYPLILNNDSRFGIKTNGFSFIISWANATNIVVEVSTNLANASWAALQSLNLTNGSFCFSDPNWTNYPTRFYRIRSP